MQIKHPVLITGDSKLISSVAVCLMLAGQPTIILTQGIPEILESINDLVADMDNLSPSTATTLLKVIDKPDYKIEYTSAIILSVENLLIKRSLVAVVEDLLAPDKPIVVNTESISLSDIQKHAKFPERVIGVNWVDPAHTTFFLEVIYNSNNNEQLTRDFLQQAKQYWKKDPYIINADHGIRARLMCALIREAFYLVENGYVSFEDIDRACRNDAGYYLPFAGNFRYMDLMGTYIYGVVMKDMNPDLSKQQHVPAFFKKMINEGKLGMESHHGFYEYADGEIERWNALAKKFSYQVSGIMEKYKEVG